MGWDNPPVPWREFERRLSWRHDKTAVGEDADENPVTSLPVAPLPALPLSGASRDSTGQGGRRTRSARQVPWAELHCHSSYSFLDGASAPGDLITGAAALGLTAIAITDHDGMYGVPQFAQAAARFRNSDAGRDSGLATVFGAELSLDIPAASARGPAASARAPAVPGRPAGGERLLGTPRAGVPDPVGRHLLVLARDPDGYRRLCQVISSAHLAGGEKGRPVYDLGELAQAHDGHWVILTGCRKGMVPAALERAALERAQTAGRPDWLNPRDPLEAAAAELRQLTGMFGRDNVMVELITSDQPGDDERNDALFELARRERLGVVASNNVHHATPEEARLAQVLAAIRARSSLDEMDGWLAASGSAYIRSGEGDGLKPAPLPRRPRADRRTQLAVLVRLHGDRA